MKRWVIGIDEAGRGALAGPVAVGLCAIPEGASTTWLEGVRDSKKLLPHTREMWLRQLKSQSGVRWKVVQISSKQIDARGISHCISRAIERLLEDFSNSSIVLLDGSLKAPSRLKNQTTIIRGDDTEPLISMASIAAKVTRDRYMVRLNKKYPYSFDIHRGYGTKLHRRLISEHGPCSIHRRTFITKIKTPETLRHG